MSSTQTILKSLTSNKTASSAPSRTRFYLSFLFLLQHIQLALAGFLEFNHAFVRVDGVDIGLEEYSFCSSFKVIEQRNECGIVSTTTEFFVGDKGVKTLEFCNYDESDEQNDLTIYAKTNVTSIHKLPYQAYDWVECILKLCKKDGSPCDRGGESAGIIILGVLGSMVICLLFVIGVCMYALGCNPISFLKSLFRNTQLPENRALISGSGKSQADLPYGATTTTTPVIPATARSPELSPPQTFVNLSKPDANQALEIPLIPVSPSCSSR